MNRYQVLYAEDVPHYTTVEIEARTNEEAIAKAKNFAPDQAPTNPDWHHASARRLVEVTDEDENIVAEFIPLSSSSSR